MAKFFVVTTGEGAIVLATTNEQDAKHELYDQISFSERAPTLIKMDIPVNTDTVTLLLSGDGGYAREIWTYNIETERWVKN